VRHAGHNGGLLQHARQGKTAISIGERALPLSRAGTVFQHHLECAQLQQRRGELLRQLLGGREMLAQCRGVGRETGQHRGGPVRRPLEIGFVRCLGVLHCRTGVGPRTMCRSCPDVQHELHAMRARKQQRVTAGLGGLECVAHITLGGFHETEGLAAVATSKQRAAMQHRVAGFRGQRAGNVEVTQRLLTSREALQRQADAAFRHGPGPHVAARGCEITRAHVELHCALVVRQSTIHPREIIHEGGQRLG